MASVHAKLMHAGKQLILFGVKDHVADTFQSGWF